MIASDILREIARRKIALTPALGGKLWAAVRELCARLDAEAQAGGLN